MTSEQTHPPKRPNGPEVVFTFAGGWEYAAGVLDRHEQGRTRQRKSIWHDDVFLLPEEERRLLDAAGMSLPTLAPRVVCLTFSLELYLKCLSWVETGRQPRRGHNLLQFFDALSPAAKREIGTHTEAECRRQGTPLNAPGPAARALLTRAREAFQGWRYLYEGMPLDSSSTIEPVVVAVRTYLLTLRPQWAVRLDPSLRTTIPPRPE